MSKPADIGGKRLVSLSPNSWAQWLTQSPEVTFKEMLDSDLQWVSRENDILPRCDEKALDIIGNCTSTRSVSACRSFDLSK